MSRRRITVAPARAARASIVLVAALACLGAAALAAGRPDPGARVGTATAKSSGPAAGAKPGPRPPRPRITSHPAAVDARPSARFAFSARGTGLRFQCRLDRGGWQTCRSPYRARGLAAAPHSFSVRAVRRQAHGRAARFRWTKVDPRPLTVEPSRSGLAALFPGGAPQPIPVRLVNPNAVAVTVTSLTVALAADPPGCPADPNLALGASSLSQAAPVVLPAGGELNLPTATISAPTIALRELPFNQDGCRGASLTLRLDAEAHG